MFIIVKIGAEYQEEGEILVWREFQFRKRNNETRNKFNTQRTRLLRVEKRRKDFDVSSYRRTTDKRWHVSSRFSLQSFQKMVLSDLSQNKISWLHFSIIQSIHDLYQAQRLVISEWSAFINAYYVWVYFSPYTCLNVAVLRFERTLIHKIVSIGTMWLVRNNNSIMNGHEMWSIDLSFSLSASFFFSSR